MKILQGLGIILYFIIGIFLGVQLLNEANDLLMLAGLLTIFLTIIITIKLIKKL